VLIAHPFSGPIPREQEIFQASPAALTLRAKPSPPTRVLGVKKEAARALSGLKSQ